MKAYEKMKIRKILKKLNDLATILDEGDYWLDLPDEEQEEIEIVDWWGVNDMDYDASDEVDEQLRILKICRVCGRTLVQTCENCS